MTKRQALLAILGKLAEGYLYSSIADPKEVLGRRGGYGSAGRAIISFGPQIRRNHQLEKDWRSALSLVKKAREEVQTDDSDRWWRAPKVVKAAALLAQIPESEVSILTFNGG